MTIAAVIPDLDGLGAVAELATRHTDHPLLWFSQYHHALHNLLFGVVVTVLVLFSSEKRWLTAGLALFAFHIHLLEDLVGSRSPDGYSWPIPYLMPFTHAWSWSWHGQWVLNAWPNLALTLALLTVTLWLAAAKGISPVEIFSVTADRNVVEVLRARLLPSGSVSKPVK